MAAIPSVILAAIMERMGKLRFPTLFTVLAVVFVIDLLIPDFIPFVDELLLGLATLIVASLTRPREEPDE
jgi:hypothetical protein